MLAHVASLGRARPHALGSDVGIVAPTRSLGLLGPAEPVPRRRREWNIELRDVSKENGLWGHPDWPEAAEMNDAEAGVFSLIWMDIEADGSPDLLVGDDGDGLACTVTYQARRAASASIEAELDALVGRIDDDYDGLS